MDGRIFSFGGGVQSVAALVLQAQGRINYDAFVFANVGEDSENPATLAYLRDTVHPFAEAHGIRVIEVQKLQRDGTPDSVMQAQQRRGRSVIIPAFNVSGRRVGVRNCTADHKINVVNKWIKAEGITRAIIALGFSIDESRRMRGREWEDRHGTTLFGFMRRYDYPLIDLGLSRQDCHALILEAGLPRPPKSACWFCPFTSRTEWIERKKKEPELFAAAVAFEQQINEKREAAGMPPAYLHRDAGPLDRIVGDQPSLMDVWNDDLECGSGYCGL